MAVPEGSDTVDAPAQVDVCHRCFLNMMRFLNPSRDHPQGHSFSMAEIRRVNATDVRDWMHWRACGKVNPLQNDRAALRSDAIECDKKAVSRFFKSNAKWDEEKQTGNPTMSFAVNNLIKTMIRNENQGNGADSQKDRDFSISEFEQMLCAASPRFRAMPCFQCQMGARCDDTCHV